MKTKRLLAWVLSLAMIISMLPTFSLTALAATPTGNWSDYADTSWYNEDDGEFTLTTAEQLAGLAKLSNEDSSRFLTKVITIEGVIDLSAYVWTPIAEFKGMLNGVLNDDDSFATEIKGLYGTSFITNLGGSETSNSKPAYVRLIKFTDATVTKAVIAANITSTGAFIGSCDVYGTLNSTDANETEIGGVVGNLVDGTLSFCNSYVAINAVSPKAAVGGIVGRAKGEAQYPQYTNYSILRCNNYGSITITHTNNTVTNTRGVGGIVGYADAVIVNECTNNGVINANCNIPIVGGICGAIMGSAYTPFVLGCVNNGAITAPKTTLMQNNSLFTPNSSGIGGIVGVTADDPQNKGKATIENCTNNATLKTIETVSSNVLGARVGGIIGVIGAKQGLRFSVTISGCTNNGDIINKSRVYGSSVHGVLGGTGGLVGTVTHGNHTISKSSNHGDISVIGQAGGLMGTTAHKKAGFTTTLRDCYSIGNLTGASVIGGLIADNTSTYNTYTLNNCYFAGNILQEGPANRGAICGYVPNAKTVRVTNCYYIDNWLNPASLESGVANVVYGTSLTPDEMTNDNTWKTNYAGFDTTNVWTKDSNVSNEEKRVVNFPKLIQATSQTTPQTASKVLTAHTEHGWGYELKTTTTENDTLSAVCVSDADDFCRATGGSVTISAKDSIYTGSPIEANVTNTLTTGDAVSVKYEAIDGELTNEKPVNVGTYKASITLGEGDNEVTASVTYVIRDYQVTFYKESTDTEAYAVVEKGDNMPETPTKDGYVFGGWFTEGGTQLTTTANITEDTTVYAKWLEAVTFSDIGGTEHIYATDTARYITFTPSSLTANDFKVSYYKVDENNNVLASATPVANAIETGKYLYVIVFAAEQTDYAIKNKFEVNGTALPDNVENYGNVGYMLIKSGVTGMQTPIYFKDGTVNLKVGGEFTNELTNENINSTVTYKSSNSDIVTVDENGKITAKAKGTATITATSEKDETTPVYASYTVNVGLATKTLTVSDFVVTAQDKVYDGTDEVKISAVLANGVAYKGDNIKVDITGKFADEVAGADKKVKYTITGISGTGAENYVLKDGKIDVAADDSAVTATISKAKVTIICAETTTRTYDGNVQTVDVSAMANGAVFDSTNYTVKYNGGEAPKNVGSYDITVVLNDAAAVNYEIAKQPNAKLIIKAATQDVFSVEGVPERVYYGDSFTLSTDGASGNVTYKITSGKDTVAKMLEDGKTIQIIGVGKVTVEATSVKDGHIDRIATKSFEAHKRVLTPTATATDRTYNGENGVTVSIALENIKNGDTITATATGSMINADAGDDKIVYVSGITLNDDTYYTLDTTSVQTTVDIAKIKIENITVSASDKKYGEATIATVTDIEEVITADKGQVEVIGTAAFDNENVGEDKTVTFTATSLAGSKAANYYIDGELASETTAKINPVTVNFVIGQTTFVYDGNDKEITLSASDEFGRIFNEYTVEYDETPNAAGTYTATIKFNDENGNYTTTQGDITVTIEEATQDNLVIVGLPGTIEYKGEFELEAVGGENDGTYEWTAPEGVTLSSTDTAKTTVTIGDVVGDRVEIGVVKKTDNYEDISAKVVFVPVAKTVTFDISNLEQTYGEVTDVVVAPSDEYATYDVTYNGGELPTDAGTYTVKVTANENYSGMQTATLTIKKATATGIIEGINEKYTYGDTITGVSVTGLKDNTSATITYAGTGIYVPQDTPPTKVGNYTVIAEITGDNYETLTLTENFEIEKATLTVKADNATRAYGEANPIFNLTYTGFKYNETKDVLLAEPIATAEANASSSVGEYTIKVSGGSAENYKFSYDDAGKLTVTGATGGSLYITGSTNTVYVNDVFGLHAFYGNSKVDVTWESDKPDVAEIAENGTVTAKSAGTVTIKATAGANYGNATATFNLTVKQAGITLVPTGLVKTYTGERQDISFVPVADFTPVLSGEGKNVDVTYTLISNPEVKEPIQAGTYSVVYTISDGSYTGGGNTTMYINKATVTAKVKDDIKVYGDEYTGYDLEITNYGGLAEAVQTSTLEEIKALATYASEGAAKTAIVKDGGYEIIPTLSKSETDNVIFTVENGTLTVTKAPLTVKVKDVTREYKAENPTLEAEYTGFKNEETENTENIFTGELVLAYDESITSDLAVGEYTDKTTASGLEAANYDITFESGNVTITKIPVTASAGTSRSSYLTVKFDKAIEGLTKDNFTVMNGETPVEITEVTASTDNKTYTIKGTFDTSVTYSVDVKLDGHTADATHEIKSSTLSIKPTRSSSSGGGGGGGGSVTTSYTVKFETDGADEIKDVKVTKNKTVAEPTEPTKDGYTFMGWFTDEELTKAYDFDTKVTKNITLYAKWEKVEYDKKDETDDKTDTPVWENPFEDVKADDWYYADVEYAAENGLFNGTSETTFAPNGIITRAMMVTVLYRNEGEPEVTGETTFEDVDENAYYAKAVVWGQQNGIIKGYSETEFAPDQNITREQIAAIMFRYATYKGVAPTGAWAIRLEYADLAEIADYATEGVMYCTKDGLMQGKGNDMFCPKDNATRAEIAAILHRFIEANK